ncbi:MAG: tyrosine-type recombinase/integrase [Methylotenera sp.]|nr:tyrosine-type recombinase/integrase [Methylococcaceae bacterium]MDP3818708.1 tyrosine-type recombinase/integrase [Methylotenera sp.]
MSIDVHKRGQSWRARVRIYKGPSDSSTFDTYAEANEWAILTNARLLTEHKTSGITQNNLKQPQAVSEVTNQLINALVGDVLKEYKDNVLPTKASYGKEIARIKRLANHFGSKKLQEISDDDMENYISLRLDGKLGSGRGTSGQTTYLIKRAADKKSQALTDQETPIPPSTQTIRHEITLLRRALIHWYKKHKLSQVGATFIHPIMSVILPDKAKPRTRRYSDDELFSLLNAIGNPSTRYATMLATCTSLRRSEILSLKWEDVDLARRIVKLRKPTHNKKTKTHEREVPLIPAAIKILKDMGCHKIGRLFPITPDSFTQAFGRAKERAGIIDARLHDLRREAISRYVEIYGIGVEKIMNFSGHKDPRTLHDHYLKPHSQTIAAEIAALDDGKQGVDFLGCISIVGRCALVSANDLNYLYAGYLIRLRPNKSLVNPGYLLNTFTLHSIRKQIEQKAKSTSGVNNINTGEIQSLVIASCGIDEQKQIQMEVESRLSEVDQLHLTITTSLQQAEALRQSILKKAFSGQLVPQDSNDEPASELLSRIKKEQLANKICAKS